MQVDVVKSCVAWRCQLSLEVPGAVCFERERQDVGTLRALKELVEVIWGGRSRRLQNPGPED